MLTKLEQLKFTVMRKQLGDLTVDEALSLAIEADEILKRTSALDITWEPLNRQRESCLEYAALKERT